MGTPEEFIIMEEMVSLKMPLTKTGQKSLAMPVYALVWPSATGSSQTATLNLASVWLSTTRRRHHQGVGRRCCAPTSHPTINTEHTKATNLNSSPGGLLNLNSSPGPGLMDTHLLQSMPRPSSPPATSASWAAQEAKGIREEMAKREVMVKERAKRDP